MFARRLFFIGNILLVLTLVGVMALVLWPFPRGHYEASLAEAEADSQAAETLVETVVERQRGVISPWLALPAALAMIAVMVIGWRKPAAKPLSVGTKRLLLFLALGAVALLVVIFCVWLFSFLPSIFTSEPIAEIPLIDAPGGGGSGGAGGQGQGGGGGSQGRGGGGGGGSVETLQETLVEESGPETMLTVANETSTAICQVFISPVTSDYWEANWLGESETIQPGESRTFEVPADDYDLRATDCVGNELGIAWGVDLTSDFTWTISDGGGTSGGTTGGNPPPAATSTPVGSGGTLRFAALTVVNDTGAIICQVNISPVTSDYWEANWLGETETIQPGESRIFEVPVGDYDLRVTDCDGNTLDTAWGVDLNSDFTWVALGAGGGPVEPSEPTSTPESMETPAAPPPPVLEPDLLIEAEWPVKMAVGTSDSIRISLIRVAEDEYVATVEVEGRTVIGATPLPVGTPEAPIERAFGPDYEAFVTANLVSTAFEIEPVTSASQSLDQSVIIWEWNIICDRPGEQTINARIEAEWFPTGGEGAAIQRQIWLSRFDILVTKPLITPGQLSVMSVVGGFIGSGLSLPWLFEQARDVLKERKKTEEKEEAGEEGASVKVPPPAARPPGKVEKPAKKH